MLKSAAAFPIRWRIFSFLFGFGFLAYVQAKTITVAADRMMPELGLSQFQIGVIEMAFIVGYAAFQLPGGVIGQRLGARRTFVLIGLAAFAATFATPIVPYLLSGTALFVGLLTVQAVLGLAQGPIFPISAGVFEAWFPPRRWTLVQGLQTMGLGLGAALTPPLIQSLTMKLGWQHALMWASLPALALIAAWGWYGRNTPREHPSVTPEELEVIGSQPVAAHSSIKLRQLVALMGNRNVVLLFVSYMCMNYTFYLISNWVFLYLIEERHFSALQSSWLATAPPLGAALGAGIGGALTGVFIQRLGNLWGFRVVPLAALSLAALLLLFAIKASSAYAALAALTLCFGAVELTEGAYWGAGMTVGRGDTMAVCGFMNTGGNLGGIIASPTIGYLSDHHQWRAAFLIGIGFAVVSALCWLGVSVASAEEVPTSSELAPQPS
jgi:ACS family glucarate transporter-like MFS transporter